MHQGLAPCERHQLQEHRNPRWRRRRLQDHETYQTRQTFQHLMKPQHHRHRLGASSSSALMPIDYAGAGCRGGDELRGRAIDLHRPSDVAQGRLSGEPHH